VIGVENITVTMHNTVMAASQYLLTVLKIYNIRYVHYRFSVLTVNIGTRPMQVYLNRS